MKNEKINQEELNKVQGGDYDGPDYPGGSFDPLGVANPVSLSGGQRQRIVLGNSEEAQANDLGNPGHLTH